MSTLDEANRREYYRIEDVIALEITPLSAAEVDSGKVLQDASPLFNLLSELHLSEFESQHLLRQISERDRTLSSYLKTLNKRVDLLSQIVAQTVLGKVGELQPVTLSEGGIDFHHPQAYPVDSHISVKLVLMPQALGLLLRARIVECRADAGRYWIATEFEALSETQRQLLARHILQKQAQARRLARDLDDPTTE